MRNQFKASLRGGIAGAEGFKLTGVFAETTFEETSELSAVQTAITWALEKTKKGFDLSDQMLPTFTLIVEQLNRTGGGPLRTLATLSFGVEEDE